MRITIEPTESQSHIPYNCREHACTVITDGDPEYLGDVLELVKCALKGYGFHARNVDEAIGDLDEDND